MFVTIFDQSILWINSMSVSKKFRTRVDAAFESADQSRLENVEMAKLYLHRQHRENGKKLMDHVFILRMIQSAILFQNGLK